MPKVNELRKEASNLIYELLKFDLKSTVKIAASKLIDIHGIFNRSSTHSVKNQNLTYQIKKRNNHHAYMQH